MNPGIKKGQFSLIQHSHLEVLTPVQFLTTVPSHAGEAVLCGQLGNGGTSDKTTPTLTSSLGAGRTAVAISSGYAHNCAILDDGSVSCWGSGSQGQLGNGGTSDETTPTSTSSLGIDRTAVAISSGRVHTCAILDDGSVSCWGSGSQGQLGNGGTSDETTPTSTSSLGIGRTAVAISSGYAHSCAILDDGSVSCWGSGSRGQLGNGGYSGKETTPTSTSSLGIGRTAVAISSGNYHTCVILCVCSMMVLFHVGVKEALADWATVEHLMKLHLRPRAALNRPDCCSYLFWICSHLCNS